MAGERCGFEENLKIQYKTSYKLCEGLGTLSREITLPDFIYFLFIFLLYWFCHTSTLPDFSFQNIILLKENLRDRIEGESNQSQGKQLDDYYKSLNETR